MADMAQGQAKKIEAMVGLFLVLANCVRISFWLHHGPVWFVATSDVIAMLGFVLYLDGQYRKASR
jgi:F0F1-type ATP synthase membrane subunit a